MREQSDGGGQANQPTLTIAPQGKHQQRRPDQIELFLHRQRPQRADGHADVEGQRQVLEVAETGQDGIPDDSLGPVTEDVGGQFDGRVHTQQGDQCRHQPEGPVRIEAAVTDLTVPFDIA